MSKTTVSKRTKNILEMDDFASHKTKHSENGMKRQKIKHLKSNLKDMPTRGEMDKKSEEVTKIDNFGGQLEASFDKVLNNKKQVSDTFSDSVIKIATDLIENVLSDQHDKRSNVETEFVNNIKTLLKKLESEMKLVTENENKLKKALQKHVQHSQQKLIMVAKLHQELVDICTNFFKSNEELDSSHIKQFETAKAESVSKINAAKEQYIKEINAVGLNTIKKNIMNLFK